jgi:hypothetical protein
MVVMVRHRDLALIKRLELLISTTQFRSFILFLVASFILNLLSQSLTRLCFFFFVVGYGKVSINRKDSLGSNYKIYKLCYCEAKYVLKLAVIV